MKYFIFVFSFICIFALSAVAQTPSFPVSHNLQLRIFNYDYSVPEEGDLIIEATILDGSNNWQESEIRTLGSLGNFYKKIDSSNGVLNIEVGNFKNFYWQFGDSLKISIRNTANNKGNNAYFVMNNSNPQMATDIILDKDICGLYDIDCNQHIGIEDIKLLTEKWGSLPANNPELQRYDVNSDGKVDVKDVQKVIENLE